MACSDEIWLDDLLDRCVDALLSGQHVAAELVAERPHLASRAQEVLELARRLAASRAEPGLAQRCIAGLKVERELGRGASATVYLVRQSALGGRELALKVLSGTVAQSERERRRFLAEARALARLRHPHVVAVLDVIDADGVLGYTMPWIRGATLAERITARREAAARPDAAWLDFVCSAGVALARALAAVHAAGMLHRDVKPSNVLIDSDGTVLLSDFGLVQDPDASLQTRTGTFLGTLAYAAPEQVRGGSTDARADIYALGATLYHALTLQLPVPGRTPAELIAGIERGAITPLRRVAPHLPRDLDAVLSKAMALTPTHRYATAQELADDLQRLRDHEPVHARRATVAARAVALARRHRGAMLAALAGAVVVLSSFAATAWLTRRRDAAVARATAALGEVQLALLDPELRTRVQVAVRGLDVSTATLRHSVDAALARAEVAADLPHASAASAILRDVLRAARARLRGEPIPISPSLQQSCPSAVHALRSSGSLPLALPTQRDDLHALGVAAYLTGQFACATAALEQAEQGAQDAFTDGLLGQLHLAQGRPERAYPRLLRVAEHFNAPHLAAAAADAAVRCGDVAVAKRLTARAHAGAARPTALLARLDADLAWLDGRGEQALAAYEAGQAMGEDVYLRRTQYLESVGAWQSALTGYINLAGLGSDAEALRGALRAARAHWATLAPEQRRSALLGELAGERSAPGSLFGALAVVQRARVTLQRDARAAAPAFTVDAARDGLAPALAHHPVDELAEQVAKSTPDLARCSALPAGAQASLVDAWLAADVTAAAALLDRHGARLRDGDTPFVRAAPELGSPWRRVAALPQPQLGPMATYGSPLASLHDCDGDGCDDVLMHTQSPAGAAAPAAVLVCSGATGALLHRLPGATAFDRFGASLAAANLRGQPVWAAGVINRDGEPGYAVVARGGLAAWRSLTNMADLARVRSDATASAVFGHAVAWLTSPQPGAELLAVGAPGVAADGMQHGHVEAFGVDGARRWIARGDAAHDSLGEYLAAIGDLDGDGCDELAAGTMHRVGGCGYVAVLRGSSGERLFEFRPAEQESGEGMRVAAAGDIDGDGVADLAVAWQLRARRHGRAVVISGRTRARLLELTGHVPFDGFGADVAGVGDLDGDGRADLAVAAWSEASLTPPCVYLFAANGALLASAPGVWRLRRLHAAAQPARRLFVGLALGAWTRYADVPLGGGATAAVWELDRAARQTR